MGGPAGSEGPGRAVRQPRPGPAGEGAEVGEDGLGEEDDWVEGWRRSKRLKMTETSGKYHAAAVETHPSIYGI